MIISIMLLEFQYSAMVEQKLAYNDLNQLQAYYLAKSGVHMGLLRVALYGRARRSPQLANIAPGVDIKPYLEPIWSLPLPSFPPEKGSFTKMEKADKDAAEKTLSETRVTEGSVSHVISSEASKINLNYPGGAGRSARTENQLFGLDPARAFRSRSQNAYQPSRGLPPAIG